MVQGNKQKEIIRRRIPAKVVEFMKQFENILLARFPDSEQAALCLDYVRKLLQAQISLIRRGNNKEVERRFQYYVNYN
jgi:hypothetical protein